MQQLLPHYERELAELRRLAEDFASHYPQVAGRMAVSGELLQDPHVERLLQAFALLAARVRERLADDHATFAEGFLRLLYPHYLRPLPARAVARFFAKDGGKQSHTAFLPRGYKAKAFLKGSGTCTFRTTADLRLLPLRVARAGFRASVKMPADTRTPKGVMAMLSLELALSPPQLRWSDLGTDTIRLYLDGEPRLVAVLRTALASRVLATMVAISGRTAWAVDTEALPRGLGFDEDGAADDADSGGHPAYRTLTDYFVFPEKFNFIDVALPSAARRCEQSSLTLHFALGGLRGGDDDMAVLEQVNADHLRLDCVPVINLYELRTSTPAASAGPQSQRQGQAGAAASAGSKSALPRTCDIQAIRKVFRVHHGPQGETTTVFPPFFGLNHGRQHDDGGAPASNAYWIEYRTEGDGRGPGKTDLGLVDLDMQPLDFGQEEFQLDVLVTDGDPSSRIEIGKPEGDFSLDSGGTWDKVTFLTQPTPAYRFETKDGRLWRLISQLSLNSLLLTGRGIEALKEILSLYDLPRNARNRRVRDALLAIDCKPVQTLLRLDAGLSFVRGAEIALTIDGDPLSDIDLGLLADVLSRLFALCVQCSSFIRLKLVSSRTGALLVQCDDRPGEKALL